MREEDDRAKYDQAEQKGKAKGKKELVIEMFNDGLEIERIAKISKMTVKEVKKLIGKA